MHDLKGRLSHRVQLTTDGHYAYLTAVEDAFGCEIDFAQLAKIYGKAPDGPETRYSPAICMGTKRTVISGEPSHSHISTSYVERQIIRAAIVDEILAAVICHPAIKNDSSAILGAGRK